MSVISVLPILHFVAVTTSGGATPHSPLDCGAMIERSFVAATAHHKRLVVKFGASWCEGCRDLERFLKSGAFQNAMGQYYEVVCVDYGEDIIQKQNPAYYAKHKHLEVPGAKAWLKSHGLNQNMPEVAILDERGKAVVCYERPYHGAKSWERFYYPPSRAEDISVALQFFADGNPAVTAKDQLKLQDVLSQKRQSVR